MKKILFLLILIILSGCSTGEVIIIDQKDDNTKKEEVIVEIKGAIKFPGLYNVEKGMLLYEIIQKAGGLLEEADATKINLVQVITSNLSIIIPFKNSENISSKKININYASLSELMTLPGIGTAKAQKIIEYRQQTPFLQIEDLMKVSGIGEEIFLNLKEYIMV